jgi:hypothetical protein
LLGCDLTGGHPPVPVDISDQRRCPILGCSSSGSRLHSGPRTHPWTAIKESYVHSPGPARPICRRPLSSRSRSARRPVRAGGAAKDIQRLEGFKADRLNLIQRVAEQAAGQIGGRVRQTRPARVPGDYVAYPATCRTSSGPGGDTMAFIAMDTSECACSAERSPPDLPGECSLGPVAAPGARDDGAVKVGGELGGGWLEAADGVADPCAHRLAGPLAGGRPELPWPP